MILYAYMRACICVFLCLSLSTWSCSESCLSETGMFTSYIYVNPLRLCTESYLIYWILNPCGKKKCLHTFVFPALVIYGNETDYTRDFQDGGDFNFTVDTEAFMITRANGTCIVSFPSGQRDNLVFINYFIIKSFEFLNHCQIF